MKHLEMGMGKRKAKDYESESEDETKKQPVKNSKQNVGAIKN